MNWDSERQNKQSAKNHDVLVEYTASSIMFLRLYFFLCTRARWIYVMFFFSVNGKLLKEAVCPIVF